MGVISKIGRELADAFRTNWRFLSGSFDDLPRGGRIALRELRELIERDLAILVHKRNKCVVGDECGRERWLADLEAFVRRTLRPQLAGHTVMALWNDVALTRALDSVVAREQAALVEAPARIPVTCRFDSHWAT